MKLLLSNKSMIEGIMQKIENKTKIMKKVILWILTIICLVFVQTCTKALFKAKRMEEQKKEWRKFSSSNTDERALSRMKKTSDIDRKLVIMAEEMNKDLPQKLDEITILNSIEIHENREFRYCYTILNDDLNFTEEQIENHRLNMVQQVKNTSSLNKFKENNVTLGYAYYKSNGDCIMIVKVYPEDYK